MAIDLKRARELIGDYRSGAISADAAAQDSMQMLAQALKEIDELREEIARREYDTAAVLAATAERDELAREINMLRAANSARLRSA